MALKISGKKIFFIVFWGLEIIGFAWWIYGQYDGHQKWLESYNKLSFNGVITDSIHYELEHDMPTYFFSNGKAHFSDMNENYMHFIAKFGDSLSKESGNDTVYVFSKNDSGNYVRIIYK